MAGRTIRHRRGTIERTATGKDVEQRWLLRYGAVIIRDLQDQLMALRAGDTSAGAQFPTVTQQRLADLHREQRTTADRLRRRGDAGE